MQINIGALCHDWLKGQQVACAKILPCKPNVQLPQKNCTDMYFNILTKEIT